MTLTDILARTERVDPPAGLDSPCLIWTGALNSSGYPVMRVNGVCMLVTRVVLFLIEGRIPRGKLACHYCDRPACIQPPHLHPGSYSRNLRDAYRRGRRGSRRPKHPAEGTAI